MFLQLCSALILLCALQYLMENVNTPLLWNHFAIFDLYSRKCYKSSGGLDLNSVGDFN